MSLKKALTYLTLLTDEQITKQQFYCLLGTANLEQLNGLCELFYNITSGHIELDASSTRLVRRHDKILRALTNRKQYSYRKRVQILRKNVRVVGRIVKKIIPFIKKVLKKL